MIQSRDPEYVAARRELIASRDGNAIPAFLFRWYDSTERPSAVLRLHRIIAPFDSGLFWRLVTVEWCSFDAIPHRAYAAAFRRHRAAWTPDCMKTDNRAAYDAQPSVVKVYRGQDAASALGLAWTTKRDVAHGFATGHRGQRGRNPAIATAEVAKADMALFCTDRDEDEVVLFGPPQRRAVHIEAIEPISIKQEADA